MTKEALKLALEALEYASTGNRRPEIIGPSITAIKEALAQPEERNFCPRCGKRLASGFVEISIHKCTPPQRQWVNLTVDELIDLERKHLSHENLTRAIEAKLKEKNT